LTKPVRGEPERAILFVGMLSGADALLGEAEAELAAEFGEVLSVSETWPFDHTDYYEREMGPGLKRRFVAFAELVPQERLRDVKLRAVQIEAAIAQRHAGGPPRPVNLDPGLLRLESVVLASTKVSDQRVYLGDGIHAELTLIYVKGEWRPLQWTFPDFRSPTYHGYLCELREELKRLRKGGPS